MSTYAIIQLLVFFVMFGLSFYALSSVHYEKICNVRTPAKIYLLLFMLSLIMAYLSTQAILMLTLNNGL